MINTTEKPEGIEKQGSRPTTPNNMPISSIPTGVNRPRTTNGPSETVAKSRSRQERDGKVGDNYESPPADYNEDDTNEYEEDFEDDEDNYHQKFNISPRSKFYHDEPYPDYEEEHKGGLGRHSRQRPQQRRINRSQQNQYVEIQDHTAVQEYDGGYDRRKLKSIRPNVLPSNSNDRNARKLRDGRIGLPPMQKIQCQQKQSQYQQYYSPEEDYNNEYDQQYEEYDDFDPELITQPQEPSIPLKGHKGLHSHQLANHTQSLPYQYSSNPIPIPPQRFMRPPPNKRFPFTIGTTRSGSGPLQPLSNNCSRQVSNQLYEDETSAVVGNSLPPPRPPPLATTMKTTRQTIRTNLTLQLSKSKSRTRLNGGTFIKRPLQHNQKSLALQLKGARQLVPSKTLVQKRVSSANNLQVKDLTSRIKYLENIIQSLRYENRTLKTVHHRQDVALRKYEGTESDLPKLIQQHKNEVHYLQSNLKRSHGTLREYEDKLRNLNHKLNRLQGENNQLQQLVQDNNLDERHSLASQLKEVIHHAEAVETRLLEYERHIEVLDKNHFHQIEVENGKLKACNKKLFDARKEVEQLADAVRQKEKVITYLRMRCGREIDCEPPMLKKISSSIDVNEDTQEAADAQGLNAGDASSYRNERNRNEDCLEGSIKLERNEPRPCANYNNTVQAVNPRRKLPPVNIGHDNHQRPQSPHNNRKPNNFGNYPTPIIQQQCPQRESFSRGRDQYNNNNYKQFHDKNDMHQQQRFKGQQLEVYPAYSILGCGDCNEVELQHQQLLCQQQQPYEWCDERESSNTATTTTIEDPPYRYGTQPTYDNYEFPSVEEESQSPSRKSLYLDAINSSCNVSSFSEASPGRKRSNNTTRNCEYDYQGEEIQQASPIPQKNASRSRNAFPTTKHHQQEFQIPVNPPLPQKLAPRKESVPSDNKQIGNGSNSNSGRAHYAAYEPNMHTSSFSSASPRNTQMLFTGENDSVLNTPNSQERNQQQQCESITAFETVIHTTIGPPIQIPSLNNITSAELVKNIENQIINEETGSDYESTAEEDEEEVLELTEHTQDVVTKAQVKAVPSKVENFPANAGDGDAVMSRIFENLKIRESECKEGSVNNKSPSSKSNADTNTNIDYFRENLKVLERKNRIKGKTSFEIGEIFKKSPNVVEENPDEDFYNFTGNESQHDTIIDHNNDEKTDFDLQGILDMNTSNTMPLGTKPSRKQLAEHDQPKNFNKSDSNFITATSGMRKFGVGGKSVVATRPKNINQSTTPPARKENSSIAGVWK